MTANIAILNKSAVALAADSTVTVSASLNGKDLKTYNSVNKLFTLSKHHPIGVMIYGNASIMGVPWETVIKQYRGQLGANSRRASTYGSRARRSQPLEYATNG